MTPSNEISAIILAAGYSRRMGRYKPLLDLDGQTVLDRVVSLYRNAGVTDIRVVTGFRSESIRIALADQPVCVIHNPDHDRGMFSSVLAGINSLPAAVQSFFVHPVDLPLVRPYTLKILMDAFPKSSSSVLYPVFDGLRGHPPLIHGELKNAILTHDGSNGLRGLLGRFDSKALDVQVADEGILLDLDTPDDFQRLSTRLAGSAVLTENECSMLMENIRMLPGPIINHCRLVSRVAKTVAEAVHANGIPLDIPLIQSVARVHDVARLEKNHASAGARLLNEMGFPAMAAIVAVHIDINVSEEPLLDEAQIVHLADKLVAGDTLVSLSQRFDAKLEKYSRDPNISARINQRRQAAFTIQNKVEQASGDTICQILKQSGIINRNQACKTS